MDKHTLPMVAVINDTEVPIDTDYRNILKIFEIFNDPDLLDTEKLSLSLQWFYDTDDYLADVQTATRFMYDFIAGGENTEEMQSTNQKPLYDWEQDFNLIVAPINKHIGCDIRGLEYLHWWTFLSAFMEIGECTFSTFVSIRNKLNRGIKLDKAEERVYKDNESKIVLAKKHDKTTQALIDEILGKGV